MLLRSQIIRSGEHRRNEVVLVAHSRTRDCLVRTIHNRRINGRMAVRMDMAIMAKLSCATVAMLKLTVDIGLRIAVW